MQSRKRQASRTYSGTMKKRARYAPMVRKDRADYRILASPRAEIKVTDFNTSVSVSSSGAVYNLLSNLSYGTAYFNNFLGRTITPVGLDIRYFWQGAVNPLATNPDQTNFGRVIVLQWMDSTTPTITGILNNVTPQSSIQVTNYNNIETLHDKMYNTWCTAIVAGSFGASNGHNCRHYVKKSKLRTIEWNAASADPQKGGLYLAVVSDSTVAPSPFITFYCRLSFID